MIKASPRPKRKLRTAAQRTSSRYLNAEEELDEPNVRLSRAFVVVLLLHVVAVGGIFAFSALKDRQQAESREGVNQAIKASELTAQTAASPSPSTAPVTPGANAATIRRTHRVKAGETGAGIATQFGVTVRDLEQANSLKAGAGLTVGRDLTIPNQSSVKPVPLDVQKLIDSSRTAPKTAAVENASVDDNDHTYVVQRGDSPALIAKRFKVSSVELLKANNIADPKKLHIGQKLLIPSNN
jgi:LysM repeat protein